MPERTSRTTAPKTTQLKTLNYKGQSGELLYVSGSGGPYLATLDGINNGVRGRVARDNISSVSPGTADDLTRGYSFFSRWINSSANSLIVCVSPSSGAAVWKVVS